MTDYFMIAKLCFYVFLAGFIDSIAGGGGLISLPAYVATGIPIHMALGSNKLSSTFGSLTSSLRFIRGKKVYLKPVLVSVLFALIGSTMGTRTVMLVGEAILKPMLLVVIPVVAAFVLFKKDFGEVDLSKQLSIRAVMVGSGISGLVVGFYDGFFGPGTGTFLIFIYTVFLHFDLVTASGNAKIVNLASNIGALATFIWKGQVNYSLAVPAIFFGIAGNFIGSGLALRLGAKIIKPIFIVVLALLIISIITR